MMIPKKVLTVAGSDCSGGAGIQADLKTFQERGVYGMSVLTVLVAMRPADWSHVVYPIDPEMIRSQFQTTAVGIGADAAKTGMLPTVPIIEMVGDLLKKHPIPRLVVDPVMVCKGTSEPLFPENTAAMIRHLLPLAEVVTPNIFEAAQLSGQPEPTSEAGVEEMARRIHALGARHVAIKAARIFPGATADLLFDGRICLWLREEKLEQAWTHGAGCTFSACLAAELGQGRSVTEAFRCAHAFVRAGLQKSFPLNRHVGPLWHRAYAELKQDGHAG